jgi:adenylate cyclase
MWANIKQSLWQRRGVWITAPAVAGLVILLRFAGLLQSWEWAVYDQYMRLRPQEPADDRIAIVGIDEASVRELGQAIIPDGVYAQLIEKLKARQPLAIGLDIYRDQPVEPGHKELVKVFESTPNLVGIQKVVGDSERETIPPPPALKAKNQVGANDLIFDADKKVRRGLIYVKDRNGETVYSFGLYLALLYLEKLGIKPETLKGTENWQLGKTVFVPFEANDGGYVRADANGFQILMNYRGPSRYFQTVSMADILKDRVPPDWGRDRIILIGAVGESFQDLFFTPYSSSLVGLPERMAGVEVHANLASQILSAAREGRTPIKSWSESVEWLWILLWSGVGATLIWKLRYTGGVRKLSLLRAAAPFLAGGALVAGTCGAFLWGWWIPVVPPLVALFGSVAVVTRYIAETAGDIRKTFGRYLSDEIVATLLEHPEGLKLGGERRKITIFTSDLRGFTATSERLPPEEVVKILNFYLERMADVITQYRGTIDEFMGDGILVLFGAPIPRADDAERAVACGVAMQLALISVNEQMKQWGLPPLEMGIGINTGEVVVGNIGSEKRTKYGIVGSQVNLTYRIESYTTGGQIYISEPTLKEAGPIVDIRGEKQVQPKGVKEPITIYDVGGIGGKHNLFLPQEDEVFFPLSEKISLQYVGLDGKHVGNTMFGGSIVKLSAKGAVVLSHKGGEEVPAPLTNIKFNLLSGEELAKASEDVYAKVLDKPAESGSFYIRFTAKPPDVEAQLKAVYKSLAAKS